MKLLWENVEGDFCSDGSLRDIYIENTTVNDWKSVVDYLFKKSEKISLNGEECKSLPNVESFFKSEQISWLNFEYGDIGFCAHFFVENEVEIDFLPSAVNSQDKLDSLLLFIKSIGDIINKPVIITPENFKEGRFIEYSPEKVTFTYIPC